MPVPPRLILTFVIPMAIFAPLVQAGDPLVLDDKCPVVCQKSQEGLFGSVESTFFRLNRADGLRVDDSANETVSSDYEFSPRYTLGYAEDGRGVRARFWGNFDQRAFPDDPAVAAQGNRLLSEASTFDLEVFDTLSHCDYDFEVSFGVRRAEFFEGIIDNQELETFKSLAGWGPVAGIEVRRAVGKNSTFFARARQSLILGDADVYEVNQGLNVLEGVPHAVTELGFGLEHAWCFRDSLVTLRGGYEWQQWRNFSYAFEDAHTDDDIGSPADAGFHGFNLSVGITGAGNARENAVRFVDSVDGGFFSAFEATFFNANRADGLRFSPLAFGAADQNDYTFTPRYIAGYQFDDGLGFRARYWGDYRQGAVSQSAAERSFGSRLDIEASALDLEIFDTIDVCDYDFELSAGFRRANYFEALYSGAFLPSADASKEITARGPVVGVEVRKNLSGNNLVFARARQSLLVGDTVLNRFGPGNRSLKDTTAGITEISFGLEHQRCVGNNSVTVRGGYEWQQWRNFGFAFEDAHTPADTGAPADAGFHGMTLSVGITGRDHSDRQEAFFHDDPGAGGLFGSAEATFFKFNRSDGLRVDDDFNETTDNDFEFSPRYTLGYKFDCGPGIRARFWGDFETRYLPDSQTINAEGNNLIAEASAFDLEVFDIIEMCNFDLELSAGIRRVKYFESMYDATNGPTVETSKELEGWGPILGAEVRRPISENSLFYVKGKHSLIVADAEIFEVGGGKRVLEGVPASITEIGLGLEHSRCIGAANVSFRGGYEWQLWHNFSYAFEDTHNDDDMGGPADAGFNGVTFSVGITR